MARRPQLHLLTDRRLPRSRLLEAVAAAVEGGVDVVQVRDRASPPEELAALARDVRVAVAGRALVVVNGSLDAALKAQADGVHFPEGHPDLARARSVLGPAAHVGASVHSLPAALAAAPAGATALTFGHIYATSSHPGEPSRGLAALRDVAQAVSLPIIAIGGIDAGRVAEVLAHGAAGVAVISAIMEAPDPAAAARGLRRALDRSV